MGVTKKQSAIIKSAVKRSREWQFYGLEFDTRKWSPLAIDAELRRQNFRWTGTKVIGNYIIYTLHPASDFRISQHIKLRAGLSAVDGILK